MWRSVCGALSFGALLCGDARCRVIALHGVTQCPLAGLHRPAGADMNNAQSLDMLKQLAIFEAYPEQQQGAAEQPDEELPCFTTLAAPSYAAHQVAAAAAPAPAAAPSSPTWPQQLRPAHLQAPAPQAFQAKSLPPTGVPKKLLGSRFLQVRAGPSDCDVRWIYAVLLKS